MKHVPHPHVPDRSADREAPALRRERVGLLVTDLVDSTRLAAELGDEGAARWWTAHDRLARDLLVPWRGREIDKTDGFLLLFDQARDAAGYALAYHRAIRALDPPAAARAGLHVDHVVLRDNEARDVVRGAKPIEVEGVGKAVAARLMALALPGQTLASSAAADDLPDRGDLTSHGFWQLKGTPEPLEVWEIGPPDAPRTPPPDAPKAWRVIASADGRWMPARDIPRNLPAERDAFVGRGDDLREIAQRFDEGARLVSLLGMGGAGKTRLATRFACTWLGDWPGGAWFCDLSDARDEAAIVGAVARALDLPLDGADPVAQVGRAIASRGRCLVVLDNFEQVVRHAAATLAVWLDKAAAASFLVTTREVLGLPGEVALPLPPLATDDAQALFLHRARSAVRGFAPKPTDHDAIGRLVVALDGIPLAIELAAARVGVLDPPALLARMNERFRLLAASGGQRGRQATLRAALDTSWDLLAPAERAALAQLSVFEGGFTLDAAEAVLDLSAIPDAPWTVDLVQALLDKSLVRRDTTSGRFSLLRSVQDYGAEHLRAPDRFPGSGPDAARDAAVRHGGWATTAAVSAADLDNLLVAFDRAVVRADAEVALTTLSRAWADLALRGPFALAADRIDALLALPAPTATRAGASLLAARICQVARPRGAGLPHARSAVALFRELGDRGGEARAVGVLGTALLAEGPEPALAAYEEAITLHRAVGDPGGEATVLANVADVLLHAGRLDEARAHLERALELRRRLGDRRGEGLTLGSLGNVHLRLEDFDEARSCFAGSLARHAEVGDRRYEGKTHASLGVLELTLGAHDAARAHLEQAVAVLAALGDRSGAGHARGVLGKLEADVGAADRARDHLEAAIADLREAGGARNIAAAVGNLGNLLRVQGRHAEARARLEEALRVHQAPRYAFGSVYWLLGLALLDVAEGEHERALARALEAVELARPYPAAHAEALAALARVRVARGEVAAARQAIAEAQALAPRGAVAALVHAVDALVAAAAGEPERCEAARARALAVPALARPGSEVWGVLAAVSRLPGHREPS